MDVFSKVVLELGVFPSASNTMAAAMNLQLERKIHRVALPTNQIHQCHQVHNIWWEMYLKLQLKLIREIKKILHLSPSSFICVVCHILQQRQDLMISTRVLVLKKLA